MAAGAIRQGKHEGYYSVNEETFFAEKDLVKDESVNPPIFRTEAGERVELLTERNYVFDIRAEMRAGIKDWVLKPGSVVPETIRNKVISEIESRKDDISVSRPTDRIHWGLRVPGDESQTIYVWLDALVNYLTVLGYPSECDSSQFVHVVGKDIAKFHCVYWPAFLKGAGLPLPRKVLNHGHWLMNKTKMSKSLGNVVDPFALINDVGINSVRSYFLSEGPLTKDSNFELEGLIAHHNKVVCDSYVNMLFRITGKKILRDRTFIPGSSLDPALISAVNSLSTTIRDHLSEYNFIEAFAKL